MKNPSLGSSLLSIPIFELKSKVQDLYNAHIDFFHIDIMDGNFVPNLSITPSLYGEIFELLPQIDFDLHFMVTELGLKNILPTFLTYPPQYVTIHLEAIEDWAWVRMEVKSCGAKFGLAINPKSSVTLLEEYLPNIDLVLLMSVEPGYGGQRFIEDTYKKIEFLDKIRRGKNLSFLIEVDGGINLDISKKLKELGTDLIVIGSDLIRDIDFESYVLKFNLT